MEKEKLSTRSAEMVNVRTSKRVSFEEFALNFSAKNSPKRNLTAISSFFFFEHSLPGAVIVKLSVLTVLTPLSSTSKANLRFEILPLSIELDCRLQFKSKGLPLHSGRLQCKLSTSRRHSGRQTKS